MIFDRNDSRDVAVLLGAGSMGTTILRRVCAGMTILFGDISEKRLAEVKKEYEGYGAKLLKKKKDGGLIMTMNISEENLQKSPFLPRFEGYSKMLGMFLGSCETLYSCDTYQFTDYSKYYAGMFDEKHKAEHRDKQFPIDLNRAYEMGKRIAGK